MAQVMGLGWLLNPEGSRLFPQSILYPRHPGKPDPRWKVFDWKFVDQSADSTKYRLYYYEGEEWSARFAASRISTQVAELAHVFGYSPSKPFSYLLFTSLREFRQANIFSISEGVQGVTSTEEATMAIPYWGEARAFEHVSKHEMTHQFQVQKINDLGEDYAHDRMALMPLWFIEGMAEYYSLGGVDDESRVYLRDLILHPDKDKGYELPTLYDEGALGFSNTYKVGQAKIDFLEKRLGKGVSQRLLSRAARELGDKLPTFKEIILKESTENAEALEKAWQDYMRSEIRIGADILSQDTNSLRRIDKAGETLDLFRISPDGDVIAIRDFDPLTGTTAISLLDLRDGFKRTEVTHDNRPGTLSLYFFQQPVLALSADRVGYIADTISGPVLETRPYRRAHDGSLQVGPPQRFDLQTEGIIQGNSLAFSPDGSRIALVALKPSGWSNLFVLEEVAGAPKLRQLTDDYYAWKDLAWTEAGLIASHDRTPNERFSLYRVDPKTGEMAPFIGSDTDLLQASAAPAGAIVYQSWKEGSPQAFVARPASVPGGGWTEERITEIKTGVYHPQIRKDGTLYALAFDGGRYRLYEFPAYVPGENSRFYAARPAPSSAQPWRARLADFGAGSGTRYKPFSSAFGGGSRLENFGAFFASGGYFGATGAVSDLMRDYTIFGEVLILGSVGRSSESIFLSDARGRVKKTFGVYHALQSRLDSIFAGVGGDIRTYLNREFGVLGALQYPFGPFLFADVELRLGGVSRSEFSDAGLAPQWEAQNPGTEFMAAPILRFGYDRILYEAYTGPISGFGALLEGSSSYYPRRSVLSERLRADIAQYWRLPGRTVIALQGLAATAFGDRYLDSFFVSSDDILRAYPFYDNRLYGNHLAAVKAELRFPVGSLFGFEPLRGLASYDIGSVWVNPGEFNSNVASAATLGVAFNIPPIALNLMVSKPLRVAPGPMDTTVAHFTLRYLYL